MNRNFILVVIITITVMLLSYYYAGYRSCKEQYDNYYIATERLLNSIDKDYMLDVVMESDEYQNYLTAKKNLK